MPETAESEKNSNQDAKINRLMTVVVQEQDAELAIRKLRSKGYRLTRLSSTGGFLGRRSSTLLIGFSHGKEDDVVNTLSKICRTRVEYVTIPLEGTPLPLPAPTPITVGGATIFTVEVDRFEVL